MSSSKKIERTRGFNNLLDSIIQALESTKTIESKLSQDGYQNGQFYNIEQVIIR